MIEHLPLVKHYAKKFRGRKVEMDDLISAGNVGLVIAWNFCKKNGIPQDRFEPYACMAIKSEMISEIRKNRIIHIPSRIQGYAYLVMYGKKNIDEIPDREFVQAALELMEKEYENVEIYDDSSDHDVQGLKELPDQQALALQYKFGLDGGDIRPDPVVANIMGLTTLQVYTLVRSGLRRLKRHYETNNYS